MRAIERYQHARKRTAKIFAAIQPGSERDRPIPVRHPFLFYLGHIPTFSFLTLNRRVLDESPMDLDLEKLFERGIDPSLDSTVQSEPSWPAISRVMEHVDMCDRRVTQALEQAIDETSYPLASVATETLLEHELMHQETLVYILNALEHEKKRPFRAIHHAGSAPRNDLRLVPAGVWDNEFQMQRYPVSNGDWLAFVAQGGPIPHFWERHGGQWHLRCTFETLPLPLSWPVYVTAQQAAAYAEFVAMRLPTEAEFMRAAYADAPASERRYPWGNDAPTVLHANIGMRRLDPESVDAHPLSASIFGIEDLVGNGWEWTSTVFAPFEGFSPMPTYPQYSLDFFDGQHIVCKGASPATPDDLVRPSFRNWFYADYPYAYAKFRCVTR